LTAKEYELLELFMRHPKQVMTREVIFDRVWGYDFGGESNVLEVYIRYLRQKLEADSEPRSDSHGTRCRLRLTGRVISKGPGINSPVLLNYVLYAHV
jgi:hypothetical protein